MAAVQDGAVDAYYSRSVHALRSLQALHNDLLSLVFLKLALEDQLNLSLINSKMYERVTNTPQMYALLKPLWRPLEEVFSWINSFAINSSYIEPRAADEMLEFLMTYKDNLLIFTLAYEIAHVIENKFISFIELKDLKVGEQYLLKIKKSSISAIENMIIPISKILINDNPQKFDRREAVRYRPASAEITRADVREARGENFICIKDILGAITYFLPAYEPIENGMEAGYYHGNPTECKKITYHSVDPTTININIILKKYSIMIYNN